MLGLESLSNSKGTCAHKLMSQRAKEPLNVTTTSAEGVQGLAASRCCWQNHAQHLISHVEGQTPQQQQACRTRRPCQAAGRQSHSAPYPPLAALAEALVHHGMPTLAAAEALAAVVAAAAAFTRAAEERPRAEKRPNSMVGNGHDAGGVGSAASACCRQPPGDSAAAAETTLCCHHTGQSSDAAGSKAGDSGTEGDWKQKQVCWPLSQCLQAQLPVAISACPAYAAML